MGKSVYFGIYGFLFCYTLLQSRALSQSKVDYRLPAIISPSDYRITLNLDKGIFNGTQTNFNGTVEIDFTLHENSTVIKIHGAVTIVTILLSSQNQSTLITNYTYDNETQILSISTDSLLTVGTNYSLTFTYVGELDVVNMGGFYRSQYVNENGEKIYLVATQFQSTNARRAFPCFDEPHYKARFLINLIYPQGLMALGNTPIQQIEAIE